MREDRDTTRAGARREGMSWIMRVSNVPFEQQPQLRRGRKGKLAWGCGLVVEGTCSLPPHQGSSLTCVRLSPPRCLTCSLGLQDDQ
ncbi:hypothetical protein NC651_026160 [Populus alba x Populus x berolinensis]|nr:hypothetical protein NC651_026160 [Populus alba x Populus x berolinensis]